MFKSKKLAVLAALLSLLMLVMMAVPAFAEEVTTAADEAVTTAVETVAETDPVDETEAGTDDETEAAAKEDETNDEADEAAAEELKQKRIRGIINLSVGAVLLIVLVILAIKFRTKIPTWWKGLKSECGKITWCPKDKLKKNVIVVVIIILSIAIAIGVLDFVFSRGMILLGDLFH